MAEELTFDLLAASLRKDSHDLLMFAEVLAKKLEAALPQNVTVKRQGTLFSKQKSVRELTVTFDNFEYRMEVSRGRIMSYRQKRVRGIAIKTEEMGLESWINEIANELLKLAGSREDAREAVERFLL